MEISIWTEIIGYIGMAFVISSFLMKKLFWLRLLNIVGGTLSCIYGFLTKTYPTAILNAILILINLFMILRLQLSCKTSNEKDQK